MNEEAAVDLWSYGCAVLRNARLDIEKHRKVEEKHCLPLEDMIDNPGWMKALSYRAKAFKNRYRCVVRLMDEEIEFSNELLVEALMHLGETRCRIVLLYYGLDKTDEEIRHLLGIKSRSLVQYHRRMAIGELREWMGEMEEDEDAFV